jgi:monoamine oxidase
MLNALRQLMQDYRVAEKTGRPVDEVHEEQAARRKAAREEGLSRRKFLVGAGAVAAAASLPSGLARAKGGGGGGGGGETYVPVAIIGGGMAGLAAGIRFKDARVKCTIFESQQRVGGRLLTDRSPNLYTSCQICHPDKGGQHETGWADGQYVDVFGELIDSLPRWFNTWSLAGRYWSVDPADPECVMIDMFKGYPAGATDTYYFANLPDTEKYQWPGYYRWADVLRDFKPVYDAVVADERAAPYPTTYANYNDRYGAARQLLDSWSIRDWINNRVPGGLYSPMGMLLDTEYNIEYGVETPDQSSFNLIYLLAYQPDRNGFSVYGESDEKWKLKGGIDRLTTAMANELVKWGSDVKLGWILRKISLATDGRSYYLDFENGSRVRADYVLMALPFSALRSRIDFSAAGFSDFKKATILNQAVGHNFKMGLQFTRRFWNESGPWGISNGNLSSDIGCQYGWDATRGVPGTHGILIDYLGGNLCDAMALRHPYGNQYDGGGGARTDADTFLGQLERMFPGVPVRSLWNGKVAATKSHLDPNYLCGYGSYVQGGYTKWCGAERLPSGNVHFAGEHTSIEFFGYFEGAADEARMEAEKILKKMGIRV